MLAVMASETLYAELARPVPLPIGGDRGRTERTADDRETIDRDHLAHGRHSALFEPAASTLADDRGKTQQTAMVETVDVDRHVPHRSSALLDGDLYGALSGSVADRDDRGRTEITKADTETADNDRRRPLSSFSELAGSKDLYAALSQEPSRSQTDRGRTELTEATETIDLDRPPGARYF